MPMAFFTRIAAGGVLRMKVKDLSVKIVISTGRIVSWPCVRALNSLQKAMMLMPCGPSAVPTGGAGLAFPAGIWSFTNPDTFLAILSPYWRIPETSPGVVLPLLFHVAVVGDGAAEPPCSSVPLQLQIVQLHGC